MFECQLSTEAHVTWLKDNKALEDRLADRVTKSSTDDHSYRLDIVHLMERDSGIYTALAQNQEGSATCTAQLLVRESKFFKFLYTYSLCQWSGNHVWRSLEENKLGIRR